MLNMNATLSYWQVRRAPWAVSTCSLRCDAIKRLIALISDNKDTITGFSVISTGDNNNMVI